MSDKRNYLNGRGFIGKRLLAKLDERHVETIAVPHDQIIDFSYRDCETMLFLSSYGNLSGQDDVGEIIVANVANVLGLLSSIGLEEFHCDLFLFTSTSSVNLPVQTPYSHAKRAAEEMILASGIPACIIRPFSVTGVSEQRQHLIPTLIRSCMEGEHMNLCLKPVHDFIDVEDVSESLIELADRKIKGVVELGSGLGYTNEAVAELVQTECGKKANITITEETRPYDSTNWICKKPYRPTTKTLPQSIKEMVAAYKKEHAV